MELRNETANLTYISSLYQAYAFTCIIPLTKRTAFRCVRLFAYIDKPRQFLACLYFFLQLRDLSTEILGVCVVLLGLLAQCFVSLLFPYTIKLTQFSVVPLLPACLNLQNSQDGKEGSKQRITERNKTVYISSHKTIT